MRPDQCAAAWSIAEVAPIRSGLESGHLSVEPDAAASTTFVAVVCALAVLWLAVNPTGMSPPVRADAARASLR